MIDLYGVPMPYTERALPKPRDPIKLQRWIWTCDYCGWEHESSCISIDILSFHADRCPERPDAAKSMEGQ